MKNKINREKLFRMVSVGVVDEPVNQAYDIISTGALILNLAASIMLTARKLWKIPDELFRKILHFIL